MDTPGAVFYKSGRKARKTNFGGGGKGKKVEKIF